MSDCVKCGKNADYEFRALEVRTLHVRDPAGERRVQALGGFLDAGVCRSCAREHLEQLLHPRAVLRKKLLPFAAVLLFGLAVLYFFRTGPSALLIMGGAGVLCGGLGIVSAVKTAGKIRSEYAALPPEEAERRAAWDCLLDALPRKAEDDDLTYIPVDEKTLAMKNGDLMIVYDLLPAIAKQAWKLLHETPSE